MSRQRIAMWVLALVAVAAAVGYRMRVFREPAEPPVVLAFVTGGTEPYWQLAIAGAKAAANENGVQLQVETPAENDSLAAQMGVISRLDVKELGGIAISPIDAEEQTIPINQFVQRGIKVVTFDSDAPLSNRQSYIGSYNNYAGENCARLVDEALPDGGKVAVLLANLTKENLRGRKQGFEEEISQIKAGGDEGSRAKFEVIGYFEDNGDMEKCAANLRNAIATHPDLACIVGMNARHGPTLLKVLQGENKLGKIKLITFDDAAETLDGIDAGHIFATMVQDPYQYGYQSVVSLASLCRGDETRIPIVGRGSIYVNAEAVRKDNLEQHRARMKSRNKLTATSSG